MPPSVWVGPTETIWARSSNNWFQTLSRYTHRLTCWSSAFCVSGIAFPSIYLCHSSKFGYDRHSNFDNMNVSIFDTFGWETSIHAPKIGVLGLFDPLNGLQYQPKPTAHPCVSPHYLSHQYYYYYYCAAFNAPYVSQQDESQARGSRNIWVAVTVEKSL